KRRDEVLQGVDLRTETMDALAESVDGLLQTHCSADYAEEWDLDALVADATSYWPTSLTPENFAAVKSSDEAYDVLMGDATRHYEQRETELGADTLRQIERQVMLKIIDARWRDHLKEMDHLQEGINLRALGQKDPLSEWQREGFEMFGKLMETVDREYVQYVMHVQVVAEETPKVQPIGKLTYTAPDDPATAQTAGPAAAMSTTSPAQAEGGDAPAEPEQQQQPVVKSEWEKTPRNAPCPCGSGKKYKACHGAA
ncbi:MAG: SEC-C metal-binding domain-containing protein, partial [Microthrixaceae bacterium]